jgi:hypothetical protein
MNIKEYASVPTLIEIVLDDKELVEKYGEAITFHTYDTVPLSTYFDFFNARSNSEFEQLSVMMKKMILDSKGNPVLAHNEDLPIDIAVAALNRIGEMLGKSLGKTSTPTTGKQAK